MFISRTYSTTSCVIVTVSFYVHSVSFSITPATWTGLRKELKGAHGVDGGQCLLILSSTLIVQGIQGNLGPFTVTAAAAAAVVTPTAAAVVRGGRGRQWWRRRGRRRQRGR